MPKLPIKRSPLAKQDIGGIWLGIALHDSRAATRVVRDIDARIKSLSEHPELGPARPEIAEDMRVLVEGKYLILYRIRSTSVEIVRVVHGARDIETLF